MPDIPFLVAAVAVPAAIAYSVRTNRRGAARASAQQALVDQARSELAVTRADLATVRSELAVTASELATAHSESGRLAERLGLLQAEMENRQPSAAHADGRHVEVFVNLSRRLQSLVHREIKLLDALENEVEDPDLLKGLFQVDHLATRIRRHAENLAVLGGSVSRRQWSRPVALTEVLRSAIAEVEHYSRVKLVPPIDGTLPGHAVASIIHLVAELIENATMFAPPHTQVLLRAEQVTSGVAVEVEDRGLGMQRSDQERVNRLLADPDAIDLDELLKDGRIGLYVVSVIARQHGVVVQVRTNIYGGTQAVVILPRLLVGSPSKAPAVSRSEGSVQAQDPPQVKDRLPGSEQSPPHPVSARVPVAQIPSAPVRQTPSSPLRPPLPQRRSQTHMAPQLQLGPLPPATDPAGDHDPGLMASFMNGISRAEDHAPTPDSLG
ncbi:sensor histidine kinase [Actinoplanes sp. HUAS TT8]|uniref:sensor histidine kinase n=1 Tax=Actinoplanes sp. HUAS TT8 TaxID=3447453 RepID=UPI003F523184